MREPSAIRIKPDHRDVWRAKQTRERPLLPLTVRLAFGVLLLALTYYLFPGTEDGTFFREIVVAALGAVITVFTAAAVAAGPLRRLWRERREAAAQVAFDATTWHRSSIQVGRMKIPDIVVVASASQGREWTDGVDVKFNDLAPPRVDAPEMGALREHRLPQVRERARARGLAFVDDPCVDLVGATVRLEADGQGRRRPVYELTPAPATYFDFSITTADLDATVTPATGLTGSLRTIWRHRPTAIEHVADLPAMAKVGVSTVVVTADHHLVLGVRGKTFIAGSDEASDGRAAVHVVAEGMVPTDLDRRGRISPAETARRGLREELSIGDLDRAYGRVEDLRAVGFFFDQLRWQPCFIYLARIDLTWDELQTLAPTAGSYWEVERLASVPFTIESPEVRTLLLGEHPGLELASNHASAALWFALLHEHGLFKMRHELTLGSVPDRSPPHTRRLQTAGARRV